MEGSVASLLSRDPPVFPLSQSGSLCCGVCNGCSFTASSAAPPPLLCRSTADTNTATHGHHPDRRGGDLGTWTGGSWCININPREETHAELRRKDARTDGGDSAASFLHEPERNLSSCAHSSIFSSVSNRDYFPPPAARDPHHVFGPWEEHKGVSAVPPARPRAAAAAPPACRARVVLPPQRGVQRQRERLHRYELCTTHTKYIQHTCILALFSIMLHCWQVRKMSLPFPHIAAVHMTIKPLNLWISTGVMKHAFIGACWDS